VLQLLVVQNKRINLFIDEWIEKSMPPLLIKKVLSLPLLYMEKMSKELIKTNLLKQR
jgi:hypothetical protein